MLHRVVPAAAVGLALMAGTAHAATTPNLITNPGAEGGPGATDTSTVQVPPGWEQAGDPSAVAYGTTTFPSTAVSQQIGGGNNFFAGGIGTFGDTSVLVQQIDLAPHAALVDSGNATLRLSGYIGGFTGQEDTATVSGFAFNETTGAISVVQIGPVTNADRQNATTLLPRTACAALPAGIRTGQISVAFQRSTGPYNDGYVDNLSLTASDDPCPPAGTTPLEPPAPPTPGVSANAETVKGEVRVRVPGSNTFVDLGDLSKIPDGSEIDAKKGTVELQSASGTGGATQTARFYSGAFTMSQPKNGSEVRLNLSDKFDKCRGRRKDDPEADAAARRRSLWGRGTGRYTTRGRRASATVRGKAQWLTQDTCAGTLIRVTQGGVTVRDFGKKKNIKLKAPARYLAK